MTDKKQYKKEVEEESLMGIFQHPFIPNDVDEVLEREIVAIGNGAHINIPKKHLGKMARVIIKKQKEVVDDKK